MAIIFSGCATNSNAGGSDWDEWCNRLRKEPPSPAETQARAPEKMPEEVQDSPLQNNW